MQLKTCLVYKFVFLLFNIRYSSLEQTNKLDCADENCTVPIGLGKAEVTISRNVEGFLTMKAGQEAQILGIFGKELFLIETDEKDKRRGFVSQKLFRELKLKKKGLVKSNVTAIQRPKLRQMKTEVQEETEAVQEEKQVQDKPEIPSQLVSNESEVPEIKPVQGKTPAGQVVFTKEETPAPKVDNSLTEEDDEEENTATEEEDDEDEAETEEEIESTEAPEQSLLSKVANFLVGGGDPEENNEEQAQISDKNETNPEPLTENLPDTSLKEVNVVQNDTEIPEKPPVEVSQESTKLEQENDKEPETSQKVLDTTTPIPTFNEIGAPPVDDMIVTTPTPPTKEDIQTPDNVTNIINNSTEEDMGAPDFKPIPETVVLNTTIEEIPPVTPDVHQNKETLKSDETLTKVPGTANVISTPPPLLGLMKRKILTTEEGNQVDSEVKEEVLKSEKPVEPEKSVTDESKAEIDSKPNEGVKSEEVNELLADQPIETENTTKTDTVSEEKVSTQSEKVTEERKPDEESPEIEKVMKKLGAAPDEESKPKEKETVQELPSQKQPLDVKPEEIKLSEATSEEPKPVEIKSEEVKPIEEPVKQEEITKNEETSTETIPTQPIKLDIDTYGNPPPPVKPVEEPKNVSAEIPTQIDNKLDLQDPVKVPAPVVSQPEQPLQDVLKPKDGEIEAKDNTFQQKRDAIKSILESDVPKHGSEIESSEIKKPEVPKAKQGVPSIIEIRRNGKVITPKDVNLDEKGEESNPHSGEYCEAAGGSCPAESGTISTLTNMFGLDVLLENDFLQTFAERTLEMFDVIIYLSITATAVIFFLVMHSCVKRCMRESPLLEKINHLERSLMTSVKENATLKNDLFEAKGKLTKIEDSSFGSNEMVIALKKDLEDSEHIRYQLQQQVHILEQELQRSTEAGNELNKMLSDLLNSQTGSESILQSVEQLQKQLDEQQLTIESMTEALSSKSRENSELQVQLSEISSKLGLEVKSLKARNDDVELEKVCIENELKNLKKTFDEKIDAIEKSKFEEVERIKQKLARKEKEALELLQKYRSSEAKIQALNECINESKKDGDATDYLDSIDAKAELILVAKERDTLKEQLNAEINCKTTMENYVKGVGEEIDKLKKEFSVAEKEKLEAQTRLDVLSSYFRQKESELQRELSIKEALWMQQQGETTTTVERVKAMQEEIQQLKSQNDSLKAEILAQDTAYKAQTVALENKAHEAWLNARQSERKVEELRQESTILRRRLTSIAELQPGSANNSMNNTSTNIIDGASGMPSLNSVPSPLRVESPNSPIMLPGMPPPPPFLPGQYGPIPTGLPPGVPPLPFIPPPPLGHPGLDLSSRPLHGRLISPPPPNRAYSPSLIDDRDRYSPDSRYQDDYSVMSTRYDTETDFSPPPSPPPKHNRNTSSNYNRQNGANKAYSPTSPQMNGRYNNSRNKSNKGGFNSSGSQDSIVGSGSRKGHGKI